MPSSLVSRAVGRMESGPALGLAVLEGKDQVTQGGRSLVILGFQGLFQGGAGFGQACFPVRDRVEWTSPLVFQARLEAGDGGESLRGVGFVAGRTTQAVKPIEVGPAKAAGRTFPSADRRRHGQLQSERERGQDRAVEEGGAALAAGIGLRLAAGDEREEGRGLLGAA